MGYALRMEKTRHAKIVSSWKPHGMKEREADPKKKIWRRTIKGEKKDLCVQATKVSKEINGENLLKARFYSRRGGNRRSYTL